MKDILFEWNPWWTNQQNFRNIIQREKLKEITKWIDRREIISIIGVRRSGKTTLFYEIIEHLINDKKINKKNIFFIKADDDRIDTEKLIDKSIDEYKRWINPTSRLFIFIDEIQEIPNWQKTIKRIYDLNKDNKIFISGSNASVLKEELGSTLAGRFLYFEIFPFSFSEFLKVKNINIKTEIDIIRNKNSIRNHLIEYTTKGSFPEITLETREELKNELIRFYFDSIFYRDIIKRKKIRNPEKIEKLVKYLLQNISNLTNFTKIAKLLNLTTDTISEYIKYVEDAYLIFNINIYEFSYKKQIINPKKIYCVDNGIRNIIGFNFSEDIGRLYENLVFINLKRRNKEIYYWKDKYECDFVLKEGTKIKEAIQVCYNIENENIKNREIKGLLESLNRFNLKEGIIITDNIEKEEKIERKLIKFIPLWKWLLNSEIKN